MAMTRSLFYGRWKLFQIFIISVLCVWSDARKHKLRLQEDSRKSVTLTAFGFNEKGYLHVKISDILPLAPTKKEKSDGASFGFTLDKSLRSQSELSSLLKNYDEKNKCLMNEINETEASIVFFLVEHADTSDPSTLQLRIVRKGELQNIRITRGDSKAENGTQGNRQKRSVLPKTDSNATVTGTTSAPTTDMRSTSTVRPELPSVDVIPSTREPGTRGGYEAQFVVYITNASEAGLYNLRFHNCKEDAVNLTVEMIEYNNGNYLSVGQMPLPIMYFVLSVVYFLVGCLWFYVLCTSKEGVFKIHYLMLALMYIKATSLLFHGVNFHFIEAKGQQEEAFAILFYIVYLMRGIFMFATIVLIGAGWTFVKHILSDRDKKIFVIVIPLQILTNVATIILSESEEGQSSYTIWKDLFVLVDLLCCGAILFPVVWSIRHLQQASQTDGKAAINLEKLKIFRHFYILVVCYIYFTRIIVLLLSITVPFRYEWLDECFVELATLAFFVLTGYKFRPASNNPYLQLPQSDDEMEMEPITQSGLLEGVSRVNVKSKNKDSEEPLLKQRESSHEYD